MGLHEIEELLHSKGSNQRKTWAIEWDTFDRRLLCRIYKEF